VREQALADDEILGRSLVGHLDCQGRCILHTNARREVAVFLEGSR
jgi:hypothetical protein